MLRWMTSVRIAQPLNLAAMSLLQILKRMLCFSIGTKIEIISTLYCKRCRPGPWGALFFFYIYFLFTCSIEYIYIMYQNITNLYHSNSIINIMLQTGCVSRLQSLFLVQTKSCDPLPELSLRDSSNKGPQDQAQTRNIEKL